MRLHPYDMSASSSSASDLPRYDRWRRAGGGSTRTAAPTPPRWRPGPARPGQTRYGAYQTFGGLLLEFPGAPGAADGYRRALDIRNARATVVYTAQGTCPQREFASYHDRVIVGGSAPTPRRGRFHSALRLTARRPAPRRGPATTDRRPRPARWPGAGHRPHRRPDVAIRVRSGLFDGPYAAHHTTPPPPDAAEATGATGGRAATVRHEAGTVTLAALGGHTHPFTAHD